MSAIQVNDLGQIIGNRFQENVNHGYLRQTDGSYIDLGPNTYLTGINNLSHMIGFSGGAVIWRSPSEATLLSNLIWGGTWFVNGLSGINDAGQILAKVSNNGGATYRWALLNPVPEPTPAVVVSLFVLFRIRKRR
jgi:hypothetical protein